MTLHADKSNERDGAGLNAVVRDERLGVRVVGRNPRGNDGLAGVDPAGDFEVQFEQLGEQVFLRAKTERGQHGGVELGVGVLQRIRAGQFQRAIEGR